MVRFLEGEGFELLRVRGSHHYLARGDQRVSVPVHGSRTLKTGTLRSILRSIDMTPEDFEDRYSA
jgi:predicted RNA binding protein YcfA (HicA-like mRNA interferase family)